MNLENLSFLKRFAKEGIHYNFKEEASKIKEPVYTDIEGLKNFTDDELNVLKPIVKFQYLDLNSNGLYHSLMSKAKSKVTLPNMIAHAIATDPKVRIEPHHHVFMKIGSLSSESIRDVATSIPNKKVRYSGNVDTIPVEALHHPNLEKNHAEEILESARKANNPYLNQMERQFTRRYK